METQSRNFAYRYIALVVLLVCFLPAGAFGQVNTADVLGTVTDPSGAAVPGASVTITNTGTGISRTAETSGIGEYAFLGLQVGEYSVKVEKPGFASFEAQGLRLAAGDRTRVDAVLKVGQTVQNVEVSATAAALQTDTSSVTSLISDHAVQDLPLNGRNYINLVQLQPGIAEGFANSMASGTRPDDRRMTSSYTANGQCDYANNNMIDGMDNNDRYLGNLGVRPSVDAIQEVRVETNLEPAEVGRAVGAVVNLITKSGTNHLHGSAFEYLRNDLVDAKDFFAQSRPELRQNQFGGSLGGPIIRDKTFFFGDYEGFRQVAGEVGTTTVPTLFEEQNPGNFSDIGGPIIPPGQINSVGLAYFEFYPKPTNPGTVNNYTAAPVKTQDSNTFDAKIDHHFSSSKSVFGRYSFNQVVTFTPPILPQETITVGGSQVTAYPGDGISGGATSFAGQAYERQQNLALGFQDILSPGLLLEVKFNFFRSFITSRHIGYGLNTATQIGFPCNAQSCVNLPGQPFTGGLPEIDFNGSAYQSMGGALYIPLLTLDNAFNYTFSLAWTRGRHNVKFGGGLVRRQLASNQPYYARGWYSLYAGATQTGNILGDLLTGQMATGARSNKLNFPSYRTWEPSGFVQDDWRVKPWLTLNLGVRYDIFTPFTEHRGQFSNFDPALDLLVSPDLPGIQQSSTAMDVRTDYSNIAPRIGFAANLKHGMVVRGGFGMSYFPGNTGGTALGQNAPFSFQFGCGKAPYNGTSCPTAFATTSGNGEALLSDGFPPPSFNLALATNPANYAGTSIFATSFNFRTSYVEQYVLQLQKEFGGNLLTVGYVGNVGRHLPIDMNINQPPSSTSGYPFPALSGVGLVEYQSAAISEYNALRLTFERRFSHGLAATANYTFSNSMSNAPISGESQGSTYNCLGACLEDNPSNPSQPRIVHGWQQFDWGNADLDVRHNVSAMVNYDLPFGKKLRGAAAQAAKGWSVNLIASWQTGLPQTALNGSDVSGIIGIGGDRPDQVGVASLSHPTIQQWFNTAAFKAQTPGTLGDEERNVIFGPPQRRLDFSVFKEFPLHEAMRLQFRAEIFNLTNTPNFNEPNTTITSSTFGQITQTNPLATPRQIQFVLRFVF